MTALVVMVCDISSHGCHCRHHHRAKHHGGWQVTQPAPGRFVITTRAGARYDTLPPRIVEPLPAPRPAATPRPLPAHEQHHDHDDHDHRDDRDDLPRNDLTARRHRRAGTTGPIDDDHTHDRLPGRAPATPPLSGQLAALRAAHRRATTTSTPPTPEPATHPDLEPEPPF